MKSLFIISLALLATSTQVYAYPPSASCANTTQPPSGTYLGSCDSIEYIDIFKYTSNGGGPYCNLSAWCLDHKGKSKFSAIIRPEGTFPEECVDIKNENGRLECVK